MYNITYNITQNQVIFTYLYIYICLSVNKIHIFEFIHNKWETHEKRTCILHADPRHYIYYMSLFPIYVISSQLLWRDVLSHQIFLQQSVCSGI